LIRTCSHVGKDDLREAKAFWELASVVFCERTVRTKPSRTGSGDSGWTASLSGWSLRYLASSGGMPCRAKRVSRTASHSCGVGRAWDGNGSFTLPVRAGPPRTGFGFRSSASCPSCFLFRFFSILFFLPLRLSVMFFFFTFFTAPLLFFWFNRLLWLITANVYDKVYVLCFFLLLW